MSYEYLDSIAVSDVAFLAYGENMEELFIAAADATMQVMVDPLDSIDHRTTRQIRLEDDAPDMLLFQFLQEFIYYKDAERLLLRAADVRIEQNENAYSLSAEAYGETMDDGRHKLHVDVKAVTLHRFSVEETRDGWQATVVLDI